MPAMFTSTQEFNDLAALWELENHSPTWPIYKSDEARTAVRNKAASLDGQISISHFVIAFDQLVAEGKIPKLRTPRPPASIRELTVQEYRSMPTRVAQQKYRSDPEFKIQLDNLIAAGKI